MGPVRVWDVDVVVSMSNAEAKGLIWTVMLQRWQEQWNRDTKGRHLFQVQRKVGEGRMAGRDRREEAIFTRLRVGHSLLNKSLNVIGKHPTGKCDYCQDTDRGACIATVWQYQKEKERMRASMREKEIQEISFKSILSRTSLVIVSNILYMF